MDQIVFANLNIFKKIIFSLGWLSIFNLLFWVVILIVFSAKKGDNFWKKHGFKVVYIFGWINLISLVIIIPLMLLSNPVKFQ
jgi:hypothetical protein